MEAAERNIGKTMHSHGRSKIGEVRNLIARSGFVGFVLLTVSVCYLTGCTQSRKEFDPAGGRATSPVQESGTPGTNRETAAIPEASYSNHAAKPSNMDAPVLREISPASIPMELITHDPLEFLHQAARRCAELSHYRVLLIREERRGLFRRLQPPERIDAWFRRDPFSVKFVWLDPDIKYGESTYVAGEQNDKVRFTPRRPVLGLRPGVVRVSLSTPTFWGEARHPVTDFGVENLLVRTLELIADAEQGFELDYRGLTQVGEPPRAAHELYVHVPQTNGEPPVQHLYFDDATGLPLGTRVLNADGSLEAVYLYLDLDASVQLTDEDFLLSQELSGS